MDEQDLLRRAYSAYFRIAQNGGEALQQPSSDSAVCTSADGRHYVVLRNVSGLLAVYRVRTPDGTLKRLKRWPAELEQLRVGDLSVRMTIQPRNCHNKLR